MPAGFVEVEEMRVAVATRRAVRETLDGVARDLGVAPIAVRWFKWSARDYLELRGDLPLMVLNVWPQDRQLQGKALARPTPMVWIRASLPWRHAAEVAAHEARHVWQQLNWTMDEDDRLDPSYAEPDARTYAQDYLRRTGRL